MKKQIILIVTLILVTLFSKAQSVKWSPDDIKLLTKEWTGERTPDGRPKVSDDLLERLKAVSVEEVWSFLREIGRASCRERV